MLRVQGLALRAQAFQMCRGRCGGRASFHEIKLFESDIFSKCCGTQWAGGGSLSMSQDRCSWNECLDLRC